MKKQTQAFSISEKGERKNRSSSEKSLHLLPRQSCVPEACDGFMKGVKK